MKRGQRRGRGSLDRVRQSLLGGEVAGAQQRHPVDQPDLLERRTADQPAVVELGGGECPGEPGLAARDA